VVSWLGRPHQPHQFHFGGWGDYQAWADHDFLPRPADPVHQVEQARRPSPAPRREPTWQEPGLNVDVDDDPGSLVRPYARTGGRTKPMYALELETLLSIPSHTRFDERTLQTDHRTICGLCRDPRSTAEVAAHLRLPLGVAKILIGDLVELGVLRVHETAVKGDAPPSMDLLQRIYQGLLEL
jgi:hypothetical protein